jgi:hypothetical protein
MSDSWVTSATIANGAIQLNVQLNDFKAGETVEISGYATQCSGALAKYYAIVEVPEPDNNNQIVQLTPQPIPATEFKQGLDLIVGMSVSRSWVSVLPPPQGSVGSTLSDPGPSAGNNSTWGPPTVVTPIDGNSWAPVGP